MSERERSDGREVEASAAALVRPLYVSVERPDMAVETAPTRRGADGDLGEGPRASAGAGVGWADSDGGIEVASVSSAGSGPSMLSSARRKRPGAGGDAADRVRAKKAARGVGRGVLPPEQRLVGLPLPSVGEISEVLGAREVAARALGMMDEVDRLASTA